MANPVSSMDGIGYQGTGAITCVEMHTTGEPTRIIYTGFPKQHGTLLQQRQEAKSKYDHFRRRVMLEPRGHEAMYGAILRPETELTLSDEADIGVLFMHNEGFSMMCGHGTIALGRFLVDTHDLTVFPNREKLRFDPVAQVTQIRLHAPCGVVHLSVPTKPDGRTSDPTKRVSYISTESFASAMDVKIDIPETRRWPELGSRTQVTVNVSFGGVFHLIVDAKELGFTNGLKAIDIKAADVATKSLKATINENAKLRSQILHSSPHSDMTFIYTTMIVDAGLGEKAPGTDGAETGLCFFNEEQQVDRSPTGSCVQARVALAYGKGVRKLGQGWTYNSMVSNGFGGAAAMTGKVKEVVTDETGKKNGILVEVSGQAFYTGVHSFTVEDEDVISKDGFDFKAFFV